MIQSALTTLSLPALLLIAPLLCSVSGQPQDPAPKEQEQELPKRSSIRERAEERRAARRPKAPEIRRADGSLAKPGEIPAQTDSTARATWGSVMDGLSGGTPMNSFDLAFHLRQQPPETVESNDLSLKFAYLAPKYVRARLESGRTLLRGDKGDYLIDGDEVLRLQGREGKADKKQLDQMAAIAASFVALTDPSSLRLVELAMLPAAPDSLHASLHQEAKGLVWMRVSSPDFFLYREDTSGPAPVYQADLAVNPKTKAIRFAVIRETTPAEGVAPSTLFVSLTQHEKRDGLFVPHRIELHDLDVKSLPPKFYRRATSRLDLKRKEGRLHSRLRPTNFLPPQK